MPRITVYRVGYLLVVTGLAISVALHVVSFWAPGVAEYGPWVALGYAALMIFRNLTAWRRPSAWRPRTPGPPGLPGARPPPALARPPAPPAARGLFIVQLILWGYTLIWLVQLCGANSADSNLYLVRAWSALGMALFL